MRRGLRLFTVLLAVLTWLTAGSPADASAAPVKKKGVSAWNFTGVTRALADARAGWFYT
ncbi:hypothetical protein [Kitasatospora camelliae]|uniref:Uncharacterized protein n=1 Tax=Kitasatospora camelliae TaxID=3156397 RepID=A0AAU8JPC6_9ACTN